MYNSGIKYFKSFLQALLLCTEVKKYKVTYWSKIVGYGIKFSEFDNFKNCSGRNFSTWRKPMLGLKMIRIPKVKNKQKGDGTNSSSYNRQYSISPLGICCLSANSDKISFNDGKRIINILKFYWEFSTQFNWKKICEVIGDEESNQILKKVCDSVEIKEFGEGVKVTLTYRSKEKINYEFNKYVIKNNRVGVELAEGDYSKESDVEMSPNPIRIIDDNDFFRYITEFILESFCYSIIESCHWNSIRKKKSRYQEILENIPLEIHLTAQNFIGQNIFGDLKKEQEMTDTVYNYLKKRASKYGVNFEDHG